MHLIFDNWGRYDAIALLDAGNRDAAKALIEKSWTEHVTYERIEVEAASMTVNREKQWVEFDAKVTPTGTRSVSSRGV